MEKEYKFSAFYRIAFVIVLAISVYGVALDNKIVFTLIMFVAMLWFALVILSARIFISDQYLLEDVGRFGRRIECNWDQITRVSEIFSFLWYKMFAIHRRGKRPLLIPNMIANYKDLLQEIIERAPYIQVDDSVKKLLENTGNK